MVLIEQETGRARLISRLIERAGKCFGYNNGIQVMVVMKSNG